MKMWSPIRAGDLVDVIAPASPASLEEIQGSKKFLEQQLFRFRFSKSSGRKHPYLAGPDEVRARDLVRALGSGDSKAIWCLRGGYGAARILGALSKMSRPKQIKLFIGLSDITALHLFLNQKWGWPTLHAPVLARMGRGSASAKELKEVLGVIRGVQREIIHPIVPMNLKAKAQKTALKGVVRGGNLIVLQSLIGTPMHPNFRGTFVFLEDVGERGYRLDRTLHHLLSAGIFEGVKGVIFGDFIGGDEPNGKNFVNLSLKAFASNVRFPVWSGVKSGHGSLQRPVAFETPTILKKELGRFVLRQSLGVLSES